MWQLCQILNWDNFWLGSRDSLLKNLNLADKTLVFYRETKMSTYCLNIYGHVIVMTLPRSHWLSDISYQSFESCVQGKSDTCKTIL